MTCFEKIFCNSIETALQEAATWNTGMMPIHTSVPIFPKTTDQRFRHRKIIQDPGFRKHQQTVPTMHKTKMNITPAETAVKNTGSKKVLSQDEVQKICSKYNISRLNTTSPKRLGNTGIILKFDPTVNAYVLLK